MSSAQLVRFLGMDVRPTVVRAISRHTPDAFSRGFVGRLMGDPSILLKMGYEQVITASFATFYEVQQVRETGSLCATSASLTPYEL